eukprot:1460606-Pyramimonas_sp.AAC.1
MAMSSTRGHFYPGAIVMDAEARAAEALLEQTQFSSADVSSAHGRSAQRLTFSSRSLPSRKSFPGSG